MIETVLLTENFQHEATVQQHGSLLYVRTEYHPEIVAALRCFDRARWVASEMAWVFPASARNLWSLQAMAEEGPLDRYLKPLEDWKPKGPRYNKELKKKIKHFDKQVLMVRWALTKKHCIIAAQMRTGKTLAYFEIMEQHPDWEWWFVAPVRVLVEIERQLDAWGCKVKPKLLTYSVLHKHTENVPQGIIYDEGSHLKGNSKRTKAAIQIAVNMDKRWGEENCMRILGTGTPQPHSYLDWWHLCESVRPGYMPWGNMFHFQQFLEVREKMLGVHGQEFWKRVQWKDGSQCVKCVGAGRTLHGGRACEYCDGKGVTPNSVSRLEEVLSGIALVVFKKDVLELPDKEIVIVKRPATPAMLNVAKAIANSGDMAIQIISKMRQLSDGFQYQETGPAIRGKTPKDDILRELLGKHEEHGRFVVYAEFTETIDRICDLVTEEGWKVLRCDGKAKWRTWDGRSPMDALVAFSNKEYEEKVCFVGHPKSGGYGLDLAASCGFLYYSVGNDGEAFMQSIERGHSANMDLKLGCTLYFAEVLPNDRLAREALMKKKRVQDITTEEILRALSES